MAEIILAPICSKCHHVLKQVEWDSSIGYDERTGMFRKNDTKNPCYCPNCEESFETIMGVNFPPEDDKFSFKL